ncbi:AAA family ATPase [Romboutsia sp.]|uniref:AAA family ATPase n=1 Tax=Romboutsia sp. TaxID=1965302 RepID=UPI002CB972C4|nr:AAA family ATPase [Romboutsia sp.]HSQ88006.1 AAA family ATPase [Romboutsia sp.]
MAIVNLLDLKPTVVSRDIRDYDMMICGESGIGKSELALDIYGIDRCIALAFEDSYAGISGAYAVDIDSYATLTAYLAQLENPALREKFDTVIIDTLFLLDHCIEKSITDSYGVDLIKDALKWNAGFKIVDKKFLGALKRIQKMGYTICYITHPTTKKVKINGVEIDKFEPKVSNRIKDLLMPEVDIRLFCYTDANGERKVATQQSAYWDARCRVAEMDALIDFDGNTIREEFAKGVDRKQAKGGIVVEKKEVVVEEKMSFEEIMNYLNNDLAKRCAEEGKLPDANRIIVSQLGRDEDSNPRTLNNATPEMLGALETIVIELEVLLGMR